jgi:cell division protein FtsB
MLIAVLVGIVFLSIAPARMYFEQRAELAELQREAAELAASNERLSDRAERLRDETYLERLARQCLGMVRPGEVAFVVVPKEGAPAPPPDC